MKRLLIVLAVLSTPLPAAACVPCAAGDPTLTVMGAEQPVSGRARFSLELQGRWDRIVEQDVERVRLIEALARFAASYAPLDWLTVSAALPIVVRDLRQGLAHYVTAGLGDAEVRARFVLLRDRAFAPKNLLGPTLGIRLPTAFAQSSAGELLPVDAQTGSGTIDPLLGLFYAHFDDPWSLFTTATVSLPFAARWPDAPGPSLSATSAVQYRLDSFTLRLALDARLDAPATIGGRSDPQTDHFSLFLSPEILFSPAGEWILQFGVRAPIVQWSEQGREEGWQVRAAVTFDVM